MLGTQLVLESRKQKFEREKQEYEKQKEIKRKKAEKLEELVTALNDLLYKMEQYVDVDLGLPGLFSKIRSIQKVYFHEFSEITSTLESEWLDMSKLDEIKGKKKAAEQSFMNLYEHVHEYI